MFEGSSRFSVDGRYSNSTHGNKSNEIENKRGLHFFLWRYTEFIKKSV